jgi:energy-coupling factor transport system permease protein
MRGLVFLAFIIFITNFVATLIGSKYIITAENLENAIALTLRFIVLAESFSIFFLTTSPDDLGLALEQTHIPYEFCFAFTTAVRFVPILADEAKTIIDSQKARGLELEGKNFLKRIRNYIPILIPLIVNSIRRSLELAEAMESRAWGGVKKRTNLYKLQIKKGDFVLMIFTIVIIITTIYIRIYTKIPNIVEILNTLM